MITLYELRWSHYCEKVRWVLDYKRIPWQRITVNALTKKELLAYPEPTLLPLIYDDKTMIALSDSSPIIRYLDDRYPENPLLPKDPTKREATYQRMIELDSRLGIPARRFAYTQIILEKPDLLATLLLGDTLGGLFTLPILRQLSSAALGMLLITRFRFDWNESQHLYEELEAYLLTLTDLLKKQPYLMQDGFTAADITLASLLRPLRIVPFFIDNPALAPLFRWQQQLFRRYKRDEKTLSEQLLEAHRLTHPPVRRKLQTLPAPTHFVANAAAAQRPKAYNDQQSLWSPRLLLAPYYYFVKLKANTSRQREASTALR